jgi:hypothetical protein
MTIVDIVSELIAFMKEEGITVTIKKGRTVYDEAPNFMKYLEQNHGKLKIERLKGNPREEIVGVMCHEMETHEHAYDISSGTRPIGCYSFSLEPIDGDILRKGFKFYDNGIELQWEPGRGRIDNHKEIPFP